MEHRLSTLTYTSLAAPITKADVTSFRNRMEPGQNKKDRLVWIFVLSIFAVITALFFFVQVSNDPTGRDRGLAIGVWLSIATLISGAVYLAFTSRYKKLTRLDKFAAENGLSFRYDIANPGYSGMIFDEGRSREIEELIALPNHWEVGNYTYVTGSGKNSKQHYYGFIRIPLSRSLPHMVLDAKSNNLFGFISTLSDTFDKNQTLSLEGDFDQHFTLYAPQQYERDALYIFTPDVMAALIDGGRGYDMEVIDTDLYIYSQQHFKLMKSEQWVSLLAMIDTISSELKGQSKRYADEKVGDRTKNIVAPEGKRLKKGFNLAMIAVVAAVIGLQVLPSVSAELASVGFMLFGGIMGLL